VMMRTTALCAAACPLAEAHYHSKKMKVPGLTEMYGGKDVGPTCGFAASPEVGPGDINGTLQTGYPCIHALSWD
jgi:hypothetical protein